MKGFFNPVILTFMYEPELTILRCIRRPIVNLLRQDFRKLSYYSQTRSNYIPTINAFCGTWYLPHEPCHNERTVPMIIAGCITDSITDRLTDAKRFYYLFHAICYSYGTGNKIECGRYFRLLLPATSYHRAGD